MPFAPKNRVSLAVSRPFGGCHRDFPNVLPVCLWDGGDNKFSKSGTLRFGAL